MAAPVMGRGNQRDRSLSLRARVVGGEKLDAGAAGAVSTPASTTTLASARSRAARREEAAASSTDLLCGVPDVVRMRMELLARSSSCADDALEPVLSLLVEDDEAKLNAIATAFRGNDPLREQWERTWRVLRR